MIEQLEGRQLLSGTVVGTYTGTFTDHKGAVDTVVLDITMETSAHIYGTVKVTTGSGTSRTLDILGKTTAAGLFRFHALGLTDGHFLTEHGTINSGLTEISGDYSVFAAGLGTHGGTVSLSDTVS
jgi:hypothetical protein